MDKLIKKQFVRHISNYLLTHRNYLCKPSVDVNISAFFSAFGFLESILSISASNHIVAREICAFPRFYYIRVKWLPARGWGSGRLYSAAAVARGRPHRSHVALCPLARSDDARRHGPDHARSLSMLQRYTSEHLSR